MIDCPKVTVVIPTHNDSQTLTRAIGSVLSQQYPSLEIIVVDDASDYEVAPFLRQQFSSEDDVISVHRHSTNKMIGGARNSGINAATGDFILFPDADDESLPNAITNLVARAVEANADVVQGGTLIGAFGDDPSLYHAADFSSDGGIDGLERFAGHGYASLAWNKLYRSAFLNSFQGIRFDETYMHEDVAFAAQTAFLAKRIVSISVPVVHYITDPASITRRVPSQLNIESYLATYVALIKTLNRFDVGKGRNVDLFLRILKAHGSADFGPKLCECYSRMGPHPFGEALLSLAVREFGDYGLAIGDLVLYFLNRIDVGDVYERKEDVSLDAISRKIDKLVGTLDPHAIAREVWFERQRWGLAYKLSKRLKAIWRRAVPNFAGTA